MSVITDNDGKQSNVDYMSQFDGTADSNVRIFMSNDLKCGWTWEACLYYSNQEKLNELITVDDNADYLFNGTDFGKHLGKMLNNKVETAYQLVDKISEFECPDYIGRAIEWIRN